MERRPRLPSSSARRGARDGCRLRSRTLAARANRKSDVDGGSVPSAAWEIEVNDRVG
jgi:hypothetical protein